MQVEKDINNILETIASLDAHLLSKITSWVNDNLKDVRALIDAQSHILLGFTGEIESISSDAIPYPLWISGGIDRGTVDNVEQNWGSLIEAKIAHVQKVGGSAKFYFAEKTFKFPQESKNAKYNDPSTKSELISAFSLETLLKGAYIGQAKSKTSIHDIYQHFEDTKFTPSYGHVTLFELAYMLTLEPFMPFSIEPIGTYTIMREAINGLAFSPESEYDVELKRLKELFSKADSTMIGGGD